jgi:hypothetical protein
MKRNALLKRALIGLLVVMMVPFGALSQETGTSAKTYSDAELDQMLAPIALYPDSLLAQVLIAATYPSDVMEADRWVKTNASLKGDALNTALEQVKWDESVKALAAFPQVLAMMTEETAWTQRLGEAFMTQQADVTASIQRLRAKAREAGNLVTSAEQKVVVKGEDIEIQPADPEVVYVPRYNPVAVYGPWWWPAYPPYAYYPVWPGVGVDVGVFGFFPAIAIGPVWWGWGWGAWNWGGGGVVVNVGFNSHGGHGYAGGRGGGYHAGGGRGGAGRGGAAAKGGAGRGGAAAKGGAGRGGAAAKGGAGRGAAAKGGAGKGAAAKGGAGKGSSARSAGSRSGGSRSSTRSAGSRSGGSRSSARSGGSRTGGSRSSARSGGSRTGGSRSSARSGGGARSSGGGRRTGGGGGGRRGGGGGGGRKR